MYSVFLLLFSILRKIFTVIHCFIFIRFINTCKLFTERPWVIDIVISFLKKMNSWFKSIRFSRIDWFLLKVRVKQTSDAVAQRCSLGTMFLKISFRPATLSKKRLWHRCFPVIVSKFLRTSFLQNISRGHKPLWPCKMAIYNHKSYNVIISFYNLFQ